MTTGLLKSRLVHAAATAALATAGEAARAIAPSDCTNGHSDSTCARSVAAPTSPGGQPSPGARTLYEGALAGMPAHGYAYWGFDFVAEATGMPSPALRPMFINRSGGPVDIAFTFDIPASPACGRGCLPQVGFQLDQGWFTVSLVAAVAGGTATFSYEIPAGRLYGWHIGLWQGLNPRVSVSAPGNPAATLTSVGLGANLGIADPVPAVIGSCACLDGSSAPCSDGVRLSNGMMGLWIPSSETIIEPQAFNDCPSIL